MSRIGQPVRRALLVLAVALASSCATDSRPGDEWPESHPSENELSMTETGPVLRLPPAMQSVLDAYSPGFTPWALSDYSEEVVSFQRENPQESLFGVAGDFNGDGVQDVGLEGYDQQHELSFVILSEGGGFRIVELDPRRPLYYRPKRLKRPILLLREPPGIVQGPGSIEPEPLQLATDAIHWVYDGQASVIYYWRDGRFQAYTTGD